MTRATDRDLARRDVRMDGVDFFRATSLQDAARLPGGNYSYCVAVRAGRLWLRVEFPSRTILALGPGDIVALSGLAPHFFIEGDMAQIGDAPVLDLEPLPTQARGDLDLIVGRVPSEPLALGSLTVGPVVVRPVPGCGLSGTMWQAIQMLEDEYSQEAWADRSLIVRRLAEIMLVSISRRIVLDRRGGGHDAAPGVSRQILKAVNAVLESPGNPWPLEALARAAGMSRTRFAEQFKVTTGETPAKVVARLRLTHAARRLSAERLSVEAAAEGAGYGSSAAFVRAFQREFGDTPARWRRGSDKTTSHDCGRRALDPPPPERTYHEAG